MRLSVTTPRGSLVETDIDELVAPGALGEFGILPGHVPFMSALKPGVLIFRVKNGNSLLALGEGVLQVSRTENDGEKILVLVHEAVRAEDVDADAAAKEVLAADHEIGNWKGELNGDYQALLLRRAWAQARVDAVARRQVVH